MDVILKTTDITSTIQSAKRLIGNQTGATKSEPTEKNNEYPKILEINDQVNRDDAKQVTEQMNKLMELMNTDLQFSLHEKTNRLIVQMVDRRDGTVLKEFPPHELLDTLANIQEYVGILLDKKA